MKIHLGDFDFTEVWDGTLYKKLSRYPEITPWEASNLRDFIAYEKLNGRPVEWIGEASVLVRAQQALSQPLPDRAALLLDRITECTACLHQGCLTDFVCHTASIENAKSILQSGKLLCAVRARSLPASVLAAEPRNAARDPEDYFYYVMFSWGNCQAGDRLVMERKLGRFPDENDLSVHFTPGVRFYFRYDKLTCHPGATFDGVLPLKVREEVLLADWVDTIVIPESDRSALEPFVPESLRDRVLYPPLCGRDIWQWSRFVYDTVKERSSTHV